MGAYYEQVKYALSRREVVDKCIRCVMLTEVSDYIYSEIRSFSESR